MTLMKEKVQLYGFSKIRLETRIKLYLSGGRSDETRFSMLFRSILNEFMGITVSDSSTPHKCIIQLSVGFKALVVPLVFNKEVQLLD